MIDFLYKVIFKNKKMNCEIFYTNNIYVLINRAKIIKSGN